MIKLYIHIRLFIFITLSLWANMLFAQRDFLQFDIGTTVYLNNGLQHDIPDVIKFKTKASETLFIGINYQRKISNLFSIFTGVHINGTSFRYSIDYNWQSTDSKKEWTKSRSNDGHYLACRSFSIPVAFGLEFPLSKINEEKHRLSIQAGVKLAYLPASESTTDHLYTTLNTSTDTYYNDIVAISTIRDVPRSIQLFAYLRTSYYFKIPKLGHWNLFFAFQPQITKNTVMTEIILMPNSPYQKILKPDMINHNIQLGVGYRLGFIK